MSISSTCLYLFTYSFIYFTAEIDFLSAPVRSTDDQTKMKPVHLLFVEYSLCHNTGKIDLNVVDDITASEIPAWSQSEPQICLSLTEFFFLKCTLILKSKNKLFGEIILKHENYVQIFTDGSKVDVMIAAEAVSSVAQNSPFSCRQRDHFTQWSCSMQFHLLSNRHISLKTENSN